MKTVINNHTKYDTATLVAVVSIALRRAGCRPGVTVSLFLSKDGLGGYAIDYFWAMNIPPNPYELYQTRFPAEERQRAFAMRLYLTAVHESKHVADRQQGEYFGGYDREWVDRPHERRAVAMEHAAHADINAGRAPEAEAAIEALAKTMTFL